MNKNNNILEVEVHSELRSLLRQTNQPSWVHHLTMARLVARGLRLRKSTLIQTGINRKRYYLSYLTPALLSPNSVAIVTSLAVKNELFTKEIPQLQQELNTDKLVIADEKISIDFAPEKPYLILISIKSWLTNCLSYGANYLNSIPTIIDEAENLEEFILKCFTVKFSPKEWLNLQEMFPQHQQIIRDVLVKLTSAIFSHPKNPYQSNLLESEEKKIIIKLSETIKNADKENKSLELLANYCQAKNAIVYAQINRQKGQFTLIASPLKIANQKVEKIWSNRTVLLISSYLENNKNAPIYCSSLGINYDDLTCLQFNTDSQNNLLKLYLPKRLPLPNSPEFKQACLREIMALINVINKEEKLIVILTDDVPLNSQLASSLAAQFGSRVKLENNQLLNVNNNTILICGWNFWQKNQYQLPPPQLIIMPTLPIPSSENPLVAAKISYYKSQGKDWFISYLLPITIKKMQMALISIRNEKGVLALLDNRVYFRSYGNVILKTLEPFATINYLDLSWLFSIDN